MSTTVLSVLTTLDGARSNSASVDTSIDHGRAQHIPHGAAMSSHPSISRWAVPFAAFCTMFVAVGFPNSSGVFQEYYEFELFPDRPSSEIILIGSLSSSLYMVLGALTGRVADTMGYQVALFTGSVLIVGGLFAASAGTQFYQLLLSQGLAFGLGTAFVYYPAISVSGQFFQRHGLANGFVDSGDLACPVHFVFLAYTSTGLLGFSCVSFLRIGKRHAPASRGTRNIVDLRLLRDTRFLVILVFGTVAMTGFLPRYFLIPASAVSKGIDTAYAAWLVGLMNGLSIAGRLAVGWLADRFGKMTALITSFLPAVLAKTDPKTPTALMTLFVVHVGLLEFGFVSLVPVVVSDNFGAENLASKVGLLNSIMGLGVLAGPSAVHAIVSNGRDFNIAVLFSGLMMTVGWLILIRTLKYL
ncbi:Riboflavin transporter MCH5-like protein 11 [Colletotrichum chlorophyti]|uniref:Riboflavin transporter MCH5-like protein 11 n=1 Tax=Colletotrichum chlorophyti TaxID=708187 RepID=A0A1Q8RAA7_9PEZI|nr:Riboflavin transporter MCH5-like protein 11 [Colletotrichum chlorophyti]